MGSCLSKPQSECHTRQDDEQLQDNIGTWQTGGHCQKESPQGPISCLRSPTKTQGEVDEKYRNNEGTSPQLFSMLMASLRGGRVPTVLLAIHRTGSLPDGPAPRHNPARARPPACALLEVPAAHRSQQRLSSGTKSGGEAVAELQLLLGPPADQAAAVVMRCTGANEAAIIALGLGSAQGFLHTLSRTFQQDPNLRTLFYDLALRLLRVSEAGPSGPLGSGTVFGPVGHFIPAGHLSADGYMCHLRVSGVEYLDDSDVNIDGGGGSQERGGAGSGSGSRGRRCEGPGGISRPRVRALVLELDIAYERKELSARLQQDYLMLSSIPSTVTVFDRRGFVLHQNAASVQYMGYRVGLGGPATLPGGG
ncbi:hypothetical protein Vretimale_7085, partial [Volvox reticuliferus]